MAVPRRLRFLHLRTGRCPGFENMRIENAIDRNPINAPYRTVSPGKSLIKR
ncbi:hypothetical protein RMSM_00831 [Rhodopirellula maiorica SM1]|uniref:Uncharacterized protein n=1 Tax=Rhodopirellula maiorica SM1 TaxID=1265738 RepID=M5RSB0_9BACT|nr:hypothetical protein RMSM_00831 [Rhodopirellula maiorica SM1]